MAHWCGTVILFYVQVALATIICGFAPVYAQANIAFNRLRMAVAHYPSLFEFQMANKSIVFPNGSLAVFKSGEKPDNLYGEDYHGGVVDEASRVIQDSWEAARSTLTATRGPVRLIGNLHGVNNWFYRMCRDAEAGRIPSAEYHKNQRVRRSA